MTTALEEGEGSASHPGRSSPPGKTRYLLYRRLGGPQGPSGQVRNILPPLGFDPWTVQPVASRYTDWGTWPTVSFTHVIFPHNLHLCLRPYASMKQGHACLPCTSSFPVHVAMFSLHESRSHHLQTLFHAVHPSVAQKDENLMVPDQEYRGDGGAQSNQIWWLPPGFVDLCEGRHCCAQSTCLLDSC